MNAPIDLRRRETYVMHASGVVIPPDIAVLSANVKSIKAIRLCGVRVASLERRHGRREQQTCFALFLVTEDG
jgi:hypothetical protein